MNALPSASFSTDPISSFTLDSLLAGAARLRGDREAVSDRRERTTFADLDRRADSLAAAWADLGLRQGETLLLIAGATARAVAAIVAAQRAGLRLALAPAHLAADALAPLAIACGAAAIVADGAYGDISPMEEAFVAAARAPRVRLLMTLDGVAVDGAVRLDADAPAPAGPRARPERAAALVTFDRAGCAVQHEQRTLVAAGLDLLARGRIGMRLPILTTLAPASFAGIVAGPLGSLLAGAPLRLHAPFEAAGFLAAVAEEGGPPHLVVPAALLPMCEAAGLVRADRLASLMLVSRLDHAEAQAPRPAPARVRQMPPFLDLVAVGEVALVAESRDQDGRPADLCAEPHYISMDERRILAAGWIGEGAGRQLAGAAVSIFGAA
ncbi:MAG: hypothetical protein B7Z80_26425 [Rhodospirillales bacterium 20-64-7]|nr:MAG: hypothetical protein B7Z80_26425 [Rhodospirillales bacterium 20-64-7]